MIAAGKSITFDVQGTTGQWIPRTIAGVRQDALNGLTPYLDVYAVNVSAPSVLSDPVHSIANWPYRATVRAAPRSDYGDIRDVDSIVAHAFADAAGDVPTVTANGYEAGQGAAETTTGPTILGALGLGGGLVVAGLVALVVLKAE